MSTDTCREIETFYQFLGHQIEEGSVDLSPEECVEAFRAYQRDLDRLKKELQPGIDRFEQARASSTQDVTSSSRKACDAAIMSRIWTRSFNRKDVSFIFTSDSRATTRYKGVASDSPISGAGTGSTDPDFLAGEDNVDRVASLGFRPVEKHIDSLDVPVDKASICQRGLGGLEIRAPQQDVDVLCISHRGFIDSPHMGRNRIAADHGVWDSRLLERSGGAVHPVADFLHGPHHPFHQIFVDQKLGQPRILSVHVHCFSMCKGTHSRPCFSSAPVPP